MDNPNMELLDASMTYLLPIVYAVAMISVFMGLCSYSVLAERKVSSWIQGRVGPNRTRLPLLGLSLIHISEPTRQP